VLRKSPSKALVLLAELGQLLAPAARHAKVAEARSLVRNAALMVQELGAWVNAKAGDNLAELTASHVSKEKTISSQQPIQLELARQALLESFLNTALEACADLVQSCIAQGVFEECFPRLSGSNGPVNRQDGKDGQDALLLALVRL
jgi:hypothetical protein